MPRDDPVTIATFPVRSNRFIVNLLYDYCSAERTLEHLIDIGIAERLQRLGPLARDGAALGGRPHPSVPADLLHVVIKLDAVSVRIAHERRVIDSGREFRRQ